MSKNMNTLDRRLRSFALAPAAIIVAILIGPGGLASIVLYAFAAVMLATGAIGYCPLYSLARLGSRGRSRLAH